MSQNQYRLAIVLILTVWVGIFGYVKYIEAVVPGDGILQLRWGSENPGFKNNASDTLNSTAYVQVITDEYISVQIANDYVGTAIDYSFDSSTKAGQIDPGEQTPLVDVYHQDLYLKLNNTPSTTWRLSK
jgi:hypothetical protein